MGWLLKNCLLFQVCQEVGLCDAGMNQTMSVMQEIAPVIEASGSDAQCTVCTFIVDKLDDIIDDPADVEKVKETLEKACSYIPNAKFSSECKTFVDTYTAAILNLIANGVSPKEVRLPLIHCEIKILFFLNGGSSTSKNYDII